MTPLEFLRSLRGGRRAVYVPARRGGLGAATQALAGEVAAAGRKLVKDPSPARWWIPDRDGDAACEICGVPHRRWYLAPETAPGDDQAGEPSAGRDTDGTPALAGESSHTPATPEELAEIIRRHTGVDIDGSLPTFTEEFLAYEAPRRQLFEERQEQLRPAIEAALRLARDVAERHAQAPVVAVDGDEVVVLSDTGMNITWAVDEEHRMSRERLERWVSELPARPPDPPGMPAAVPALEMARRIAQRHRDATCQICMTRYSRCYCKEDARA